MRSCKDRPDIMRLPTLTENFGFWN